MRSRTLFRSLQAGVFTLALIITGCTPKADAPKDHVSSDVDTATLVRDPSVVGSPGPVHQEVHVSVTDSAGVTRVDTKVDTDEKTKLIIQRLNGVESARGLVFQLPEKVLFGTGQAEISPDATHTLEQVRDLILHFNASPVSIHGYTDNKGEPAANKVLSEKRAIAVKDYLVSKLGVNSARFNEAEGYGEKDPVASNATPEGQAQNRRVELIIKTK